MMIKVLNKVEIQIKKKKKSKKTCWVNYSNKKENLKSSNMSWLNYKCKGNNILRIGLIMSTHK